MGECPGKISDHKEQIYEDPDVFEGINSIDEKISKLLIENGIDSIDALRNKTIDEYINVYDIPIMYLVAFFHSTWNELN